MVGSIVHDNTGFGGMYVNATQPFYGYAAAGSVKAYTHYAESNGIKSLELREIADTPYYWINENKLINAYNGVVKDSITKQEAIIISNNNILDEYKISDIEIIYEVGNHHEYREKPLPAYVISYDGSDKLKSYISIKDGQFQTVRHRSWRWFDFLWMTHTMDYDTRDDFNNKLIRAFSVMGLITVMSGFLLWLVTSKTIRKIFKKKFNLN